MKIFNFIILSMVLFFSHSQQLHAGSFCQGNLKSLPANWRWIFSFEAQGVGSGSVWASLEQDQQNFTSKIARIHIVEDRWTKDEHWYCPTKHFTPAALTEASTNKNGGLIIVANNKDANAPVVSIKSTDANANGGNIQFVLLSNYVFGNYESKLNITITRNYDSVKAKRNNINFDRIRFIPRTYMGESVGIEAVYFCVNNDCSSKGRLYNLDYSF